MSTPQSCAKYSTLWRASCRQYWSIGVQK